MTVETNTPLLGREEVAKGIWAVRLARPKEYSFRAGQWCFLTLPAAGFADERGLRRPLSLASAPEEDDLLFATKASTSAFKQTLLALPLGTRIAVDSPRGDLSLPAPELGPLAFLAGGVGITPFRSLLHHVARARTGHRVTLLYSNRTPEETPFLDDLGALAAAHGNLRVVATMTRMVESARTWDGPTGRLDADLIRQECPDWPKTHFILAGPPPMVEAMEKTLQELGVPPERLRAERFAGG